MIFRLRCGILLHAGDEVLMLHNTSEDRAFWVFPGGGIHRGERLKNALARELSEELGVDLTGLPEPRPTIVAEVLELIHRLEIYFSIPLPKRLQFKGREVFASTAEYVPLREVNSLLPHPYFPPVFTASEILEGPGLFCSSRLAADPNRIIHVRVGNETKPMSLIQYLREFVVPNQAGIQVEVQWPAEGRVGATPLTWLASLHTPVLEQVRHYAMAAGIPEEQTTRPTLMAIQEYIDSNAGEHTYRFLFGQACRGHTSAHGQPHLRFQETGTA